MAEQKTKPTAESVEGFIKKLESEQIRDDCRNLVKLMKRVTGFSPKMWGPTIIGFGSYHYIYDSGHEGDSCLAAFAPRKDKLVLYVIPEAIMLTGLMSKLGKYKATKCCIYIKKLEDIDIAVLEKLIKYSIDYTRKKYPEN